MTPRGLLTILAAFVRRDFAAARSYRLPFVMEIFATLFMLTLFFFLARVVDTGDVTRFEGMADGYFPFVVVGMAVFRMVQTALTSFTSKLRTEQTTGTLEALLATPTPPSLVILGSSAYDLLRGVLSAALMLGLAATLGLRFDVSPASVGAALLVTAASVGLFAALGVLIAAFTMVFKQASGLVALVTGGLALLGGVYFPVEVFPGWLQAVASALPFTWSIDLLRGALLGSTVDGARLLWLATSAVVSLAVALAAFVLAVDHARRRGTLGQY